MVMMIIIIAERIVVSMCVVLCMIAFYFRLPAKSLRTYLLSEATSSRCCADSRHEVLVEACSRLGGSTMHRTRRNLRVQMCVHVWGWSPNGQPATHIHILPFDVSEIGTTSPIMDLWCAFNVNIFPPLSLMCWWCLLLNVQRSLCQVCAALVSLFICVSLALPRCSFSTHSSVTSARWRCRPERIVLRLHSSVHTDVGPINITAHTGALGSLDPTRGSDFRSRSVCQYQKWLRVQS